MAESNILVVDDNREIREIIHILLSGEGYHIEEASDGVQALKQLRKMEFDLIILDVMMPHLNGYQTCMEMRKISNAPILFLSAKSQDDDKTIGFASGGDDYLAKPFSYSELTARVKALTRRYRVYQGKPQPKESPVQTIRIQHVEIDEQTETVRSKGEKIELTDTEFAMLLVLAKNRKQLFSMQRLYEVVWNEPYYYSANNTVMVHIRNLRKKIETDPQNPTIIKTVWGKGYRCD